MKKVLSILSLAMLCVVEIMTSLSYADTSQVSVTFNSNGGSAVEGAEVGNGNRLVEPEAPTRDGYEFKGWAVEETDYTVKYLEKGTAMMLAEDKVVTKVPVGTIVTENAEDIDGYYVAGNSKKMKKVGKRFEDNEINFYYGALPKETYNVNYLEMGTDEVLAPQKVVTDQTVGTTVVEKAIDISGYSAAGLEQDLTIKQSTLIKKTDFATPTDGNGGWNIILCDELQCNVDGIQRSAVVVKTDDYYIVWIRDELNSEEKEQMYYSFTESVDGWRNADYADVKFISGNGASLGGVTISGDSIYFDEVNDWEIIMGLYTKSSEEVIDLARNEITFYYEKLPEIQQVSYTIICMDMDTSETLCPDTIKETEVGTTVTEYAPEVEGYMPLYDSITFEVVGDDVLVFVYYYSETLMAAPMRLSSTSEPTINPEEPEAPEEEIVLGGMIGNAIGELLGDPEGNYRYWDFENDKFYYDTELIAVWEPITYTIDYEGVDRLENLNPTEYTVETENFDLVSLEKDGYIFEGWYTSEGNQISQIVKGSTGNLVLHPQRKDPAPKYSGGGSRRNKKNNGDNVHNSADTTNPLSDITNEELKEVLDFDISDKTEKESTNEMIEAYKFAYDNGITSKESFEEADTDGLLNREELAKMLSQFAINVMGKEPEEGKAGCISFNDIERESSEMKGYMKTACELGLMGLESDGITVANHFDPRKSVTRAEFGTTLSRLLYQGANNLHNEQDRKNNKRYEKHLRALKDNGIMTQIDGEWVTKKELRGYVMMMLMRSAK